MRIFVDVGAHYGETLAVALDPKWGFDRVYSLEPSSACFRVLARHRDPRLVCERIALSSRNGTATLHGSGLLGASVYAGKTQLEGAAAASETIDLVRASEWLETLPAGEIFLKMNCEGSEADILEDLLDSGAIRRVASIYVDFDIRKVPGQEGRQAAIEARLGDVRRYTVDVRGANGNDAVLAWLERDCPKVPVSARARLAHALRLYEPAYDRAVDLLSHVLPRRMFFRLGRRFGRMSRARA